MRRKRYVHEFAQDMLQTDAENTLMLTSIKELRKTRIENILRVYERGMLTDIEAVRAIAMEYPETH